MRVVTLAFTLAFALTSMHAPVHAPVFASIRAFIIAPPRRDVGRRRTALLTIAAVGLTVLAPSGTGAQQPARPSPPANTPAREAAQFDFLVGQWELEVTPKVSSLAARIHGAPRLLGSWKGWKALDGHGIEDELRIVDRSGNPTALSLAVRVWNAAERRWVVSSTDAYRARVTQATAQWDGTVMSLVGTADGGMLRTRSRFSAITPGTFRFEQDRSEDGGKTWQERALVIQARRVAAVAPR